MDKICTSIEQSQKLIELGIDINTADMSWLSWMKDGKPRIGFNSELFNNLYDISDFRHEYMPAWSLSALINIIEIEKVEICFNCNNNKYWVDAHFESLGSFLQDHELYDSKIDALIAIIKKLKSRNLL